MATTTVYMYGPTPLGGPYGVFGGSAAVGAASPAMFAQLQQVLQDTPLGGRSVVLNANGDTLVPGSGLPFPGADAITGGTSTGSGYEAGAGDFSAEPVDIVAMVKAGWIWVDWCDSPMAYRYDGPLIGVRPRVGGYTDRDGGAWYNLAMVPMGAAPLTGPASTGDPTFNIGSFGASGGIGSGYPYPGGLIVRTIPYLSPDGTPFPMVTPNDVFAVANESTPPDAINGLKTINGVQYEAYPIIGVLYRNGAYVWAYGSAGGPSVSASTLGQFIAGMLSAQFLKTRSKPATVSSPQTTPGSSPTPPKSGAPKWLIYGAGGAGVLLFGLGWYDYELHKVGAERIVINE